MLKMLNYIAIENIENNIMQGDWGAEVHQLYLLQRLSVAVQRGNSASVMGTMDLSTTTDFFN